VNPQSASEPSKTFSPPEPSKSAPKPETGQLDSSSASSEEKQSDAGDSKLARRLAEIAKAERRVKDRMAEIEASGAEMAKLKSFAEAKSKGDRIAALQTLFTQDELEDIYQSDLTNWILSKAAPTPEQKAKAEEERIRKAAKEVLEEQAQTSAEGETKALQEAQQGYLARANKEFQAKTETYPLIAHWGLSAGDMLSYTEEVRRKEGRVPPAAEVFDHFERRYASRIEAAGYTRKQVEAPRVVEQTKPNQTVTTRWTADSSQPAKPIEEMSLEEAKAAIKRKYLRS
jgi:hypothetical protein